MWSLEPQCTQHKSGNRFKGVISTVVRFPSTGCFAHCVNFLLSLVVPQWSVASCMMTVSTTFFVSFLLLCSVQTVWVRGDSTLVSSDAFKCTVSCAKVDHSDWSDVLSEVVTEGVTRKGIRFNAVDFKKLRTNGPVRRKFLDYLNVLQETDISKLGGDEAVAFLINAYNAFAIDLIVKENVKGSIRDLTSLEKGSVFARFKWDLNDGGNAISVSLNNIEHDILRATVTEHDEPRVHAAVNCVSLSCPDLFPEAFTAEKLDKQLDSSMKNWLTNPTKGIKVDRANNEVLLSTIFSWFKEDFVSTVHGGKNDLVDFPTQLDFALEFMSKDDRKFVKKNNPAVRFMVYNWQLIKA